MRIRLPFFSRLSNAATSAKDRVTGAKKTHRLRNWLIGIASVLGVIVLVATSGILWLTKTDAGRAKFARLFEKVIGTQIRGSMTVGRVVNVEWDNVHATEVVFRAADGQEVIHADDLQMDLQWFQMLRAHFIVPYAKIRGGRVFVRNDRQGKLALDTAFRGKTAGGQQEEGESPIDFQNLDIAGVDLLVRMEGVPDVTMHNIRTNMHMWVPNPGAPARFDMTRLRANIDIQTPIPFTIRTSGGQIQYDGGSSRRANVDLRGEVSGAEARLTTRVVVRRDEPHIKTTLHLQNVGGWLANAPLILQASVANIATDAFEFSVEMD
ncbi:MAG: hypothetical protein IPK60_02665 [Sandaracinaceae bacterium]|nr:hypothetical protein [Sandaracinaceae bacterium]